jgi:hypothetical protein
MSRRPEICPRCHRPFAPRLVVSGPVRRRLVEIVANYPDGIGLRELVDLVYDDPSGGPLTAQRSLNVIAHHANKQLAKQGYQIKSTWRGRGARYQLVKVVP